MSAIPAASKAQSRKNFVNASDDDFHIPSLCSAGIVIIFRCKAGGKMKDNAAIVKEPKIAIMEEKHGSNRA